jgi:hypothetical protein
VQVCWQLQDSKLVSFGFGQVWMGPLLWLQVDELSRGVGPNAEEALYTLHDDLQWLKVISDTLAGTEGGVVVEGDLKKLLGFVGRRGHRAWRRLRVRHTVIGLLTLTRTTRISFNALVVGCASIVQLQLTTSWMCFSCATHNKLDVL